MTVTMREAFRTVGMSIPTVAKITFRTFSRPRGYN